MSSCVHYKFANSKDYSTIAFNGLTISLADFRDAVLVQKKMAKSATFALEIVNAQSKEEYKGDPSQTQIPRNASVLVRRVPVKSTKKVLETTVVTGKADSPDPVPSQTAAKPSKTMSLASSNVSERDKLNDVMKEGTDAFDPANLPKISMGRGRGRPAHFEPIDSTTLPSNYVCYRCGEKGHHIRQCPNPKSDVPIHPHGNKGRDRSSGIPSAFLVPAANANEPGSFVNRDGKLVVSILEREAYTKGKKLTKRDFPEGADVPDAPMLPTKEERAVPEELACNLCHEIMKDCVLIPCCGLSFCDECIRDYLIKNNFVCPSCKELTSPDRLTANASVRLSVAKFLNTNLQDGPIKKETAVVPCNVQASSGPKKIEFRLKTPASTVKSEPVTTASPSNTSASSVNVSEKANSAAETVTDSNGAVPSEKEATASSRSPTPRQTPVPSGDEGSTHSTSASPKTVSRSQSRSPVQSGSDTEKINTKLSQQIAQDLQKTYMRVAAAAPGLTMPAAVPAPILPFAPAVAPGIFPSAGAALFARGAVPTTGAPLSEEDFYRLRQELTGGHQGGISRSPTCSPSLPRSHSSSPSPRPSRHFRSRHSPHLSRSRSRTRSPPNRSPVHNGRPRSPTPPPRSSHRVDRYRERSSYYEDHSSGSRHDSRYRRRHSRSPPSHPSMSDFEAYRAWYEYHHGSGSRHTRHPSPPPLDKKYHGSRDVRYRDERSREDRREDRYRDEYHDSRRRRHERDTYRVYSHSPPPRHSPAKHGHSSSRSPHRHHRVPAKRERSHTRSPHRHHAPLKRERSPTPEKLERSPTPVKRARSPTPVKRARSPTRSPSPPQSLVRLERSPSPIPTSEAPLPKKKRRRIVELVSLSPVEPVDQKESRKEKKHKKHKKHRKHKKHKHGKRDEVEAS